MQLASHLSTGMAIYGPTFPAVAGLASLYGLAFQYADKVLNRAQYTGGTGAENIPDALSNYLKAVAEGTAPLDFVLYVPKRYGTLGGMPVPNVRETGEAGKPFTVEFGGQETW